MVTRLGSIWIAALLMAPALGASAKDITVTVTAPDHATAAAPVSALIPAQGSPAGAVVLAGERVYPAAVRPSTSAGKVEVTWVAPALEAGESREFTVRFQAPKPGGPVSLTVSRVGKDLEIKAGGDLIARYDVTTGPNKPYFYPLYGPGQTLMARRYPLEKAAGETTDHPHHRGMWFTHGDVNGEDYWTEGGKTAKTVHVRYDRLMNGQGFAGFVATTDWIDREGKQVAQDVRDVRVYVLPEGRLFDVRVTVKPTAGPLTFGDTKEGSFGLRVPDSMRVAGGDGHIVTSEGVRDVKAWGTRADWVDYYGTVAGRTMGVAMFDMPDSFRHPTYWHVRDYGLFAANPFGIHDFVKGQPAGAGNYTVPAGGALTFHYAILLHEGTTEGAGIADLGAALTRAPRITVR